MFIMERLKNLQGAAGYGSCDSCRVLSVDDDSLIRIKTSDNSKSHSSICLCGKCAEKLLNRLENIKNKF